MKLIFCINFYFNTVVWFSGITPGCRLSENFERWKPVFQAAVSHCRLGLIIADDKFVIDQNQELTKS